MSKVMDRVSDLEAVDWASLPLATLQEWECLAVSHDRACRCEKCALFFARRVPEAFSQAWGCAIEGDVIRALQVLLTRLNKM